MQSCFAEKNLLSMHAWEWKSACCVSVAGVTNLFAIVGHFVSYCWVSGPHNFLVILWNLLKTKTIVHQQKQTTNESNNCWSRLNASRGARNSFVGDMRTACSSPLIYRVKASHSTQVWCDQFLWTQQKPNDVIYNRDISWFDTFQCSNVK